MINIFLYPITCFSNEELGQVTKWYQSRVKTPWPNGLTCIQICCELYELSMRIYVYLMSCMLYKYYFFNVMIIRVHEVFLLELCSMHEVSFIN